jgi:hypothetical protein
MPRRQAQYEEEEEDDLEDEEEEYDVGDIVDQAINHPKVRDLFSKAGQVFDRIGQVIDQVARHAPQGNPGPRTASGSHPPTPPGPKRIPIDPYVVLGLDRRVQLTVEIIKARKRALSKIYHPDPTGKEPEAIRKSNEEAIRRVNAASDMLMKKIGAK